jgi:hypothetical protein
VLREVSIPMTNPPPVRQLDVPVRAVTRGPDHHFFGYYEKSPWDATGRFILAMEAAFPDRMPTADDPLTVGMIDTHDGDRFVPLDTTLAWCWQQGTMLQWVPGAADRLIVYNQRQGDRFVAVVRDVKTGETRTLSRPVYGVSPDGSYALSVNFSRLHRVRPGYGYEGGRDPSAGRLAPDDDGVFRVDLATGASELILSLERAARLKPAPSMAGVEQKFNHTQINTDGSRFAVLHRWYQSPQRRHDRLVTANADGSDPYVLADDDHFSHYDWFDRTRLLGWANRPALPGAPDGGVAGRRYWMFTDRTTDAHVVGDGVLTVDGHCSFSPDRRWVLTDTYPDRTHHRTLILYRLQDGQRIDIGRFYAPPELSGPLRCDLHPRWSRDGRLVCIDSAHEGSRQMYVLDVTGVVGEEG